MPRPAHSHCDNSRTCSNDPGGVDEPERYNGLQVLRALAALLVLVCHADHVAETSWPLLTELSLGAGGAFGVDLFFVLSGFVVAMAAERPSRTAGRFLFDRATRVLPPYLILSLPFAALQVPSAALAVNSVLFLPLLDAPGRYTYTVHPYGWSLACEMWFYGVVACCVAAAPSGARIFALGAAACALVVASFVWGSFSLVLAWTGSPLFLEFAAGALLFRFRALLSARVTAVALPAGTALAALTVTGAPNLGGHTGFSIHGLPDAGADFGAALVRAALWGLPAALLVASAVGAERAGFRHWPRALVALGDRSYSLYLVQPFAITVLAEVAWPHFLPAWAALLALVLFMSWASHRWIERPATERLRALLCAGPAGMDKAAARAGPDPIPSPWLDRSLP